MACVDGKFCWSLRTGCEVSGQERPLEGGGHQYGWGLKGGSDQIGAGGEAFLFSGESKIQSECSEDCR